jgi:predicted amidohydrolase
MLLSRFEHIGIIQFPIMSGDGEANLASLQKLVRELNPPQNTLIVLPELWGTGFAYKNVSSFAETSNWLYGKIAEMASSYQIVFAGSLPEPIAGKPSYFYNTLKLIGPTGVYGAFRKHYLFPGEELAFCEWPFMPKPIYTPYGIVGCLVCYDIRFPEIARIQCQQGASLLICSAEWPADRIHHLRTLGIARAIENQTFIAVCNGLGTNGNIPLGGQSFVAGPDGNLLCDAGDDPFAGIVTIPWEEKEKAQQQFRSFSVDPFMALMEMKIATPLGCIEESERRSSIGQRVILVYLDLLSQTYSNARLLERARRMGDFLVVAAKIPIGVQIEEKQKNELIEHYAALASVNLIFFSDQLTEELASRMEKASYRMF